MCVQWHLKLSDEGCLQLGVRSSEGGLQYVGRYVCPGMYGESSEPILMRYSGLFTVMV